MQHTTTKTISFQMFDEEIVIEVEASFAYDANYGADADGNRGMARWELDEAKYPDPVRANGTLFTKEEMDAISDKVTDLLCDIDFSDELPDDGYDGYEEEHG